MSCAEASRLEAYFDGELDDAGSAALEQHLATCAQCQTALADMEGLRSLLRSPAARVAAPKQLRARLTAALNEEQSREPRSRPPALAAARSRPFWAGVLSGIGGSAVTAALGFFVLLSLLNNPLPGELVADHTHSLMSSHLIDVVSTDQHTVKPWFAGRTDVSPVVADFAKQGYVLLGGRVEVLNHQRASVLVYQHGAHFINVYTWRVSSGAVPADTTRNGYHLAFWKEGDLGYCAVSDTAWSELKGLVGLMQNLSERDTPQ